MICPFAPRFPFEEMRILPKMHDAHYEDATKIEIKNLAALFQRVEETFQGALLSAVQFHAAQCRRRTPVLSLAHKHHAAYHVTRRFRARIGININLFMAPEVSAQYL